MKETSEKNYYVMYEKEVVFVTPSFEEAINKIISFNLHTLFYGEKINSEKKYHEYFDWHSGIRCSCDGLLDENDNEVDAYIIEEFYINQYPDILAQVNDYLKKKNLPLIPKEWIRED